ncbi:carbohydrate esterase family 4 protein [Roridomyces roridus]|uniref:chitin deacetylase n=1 Tax=Roridomyces roridus TaxID=1738132 RepID=A0AAD7BA55_9AGAR|nr:carbohydrate esterase family 4 protein [Roridomyces roridus]
MRLSTSSLVVLLALSAGADRTTEAGEASITDPNAECTPYYYAPVSDHSSDFPAIWQHPEEILSNDSEGQAKFDAMSASIPNIPPKGTLNGDFSGMNYPASDPDCWWTDSKCITPKLAGLQPDVANVPEPRTLGYGFDDGPNCSHNAFYAYLESRNQKATMFYIGSNVMDWPLEAQRGVADGHQICVHTWSHRYMTAATNVGAFAELWYTMKAIKLVCGVTPTCWRPPYGDVDDRIRYIATQLGLQTVIWKYDSNDWSVGTNGVTRQTVQDNYDHLINLAQNGTFDTVGAIILTHELNNYTMQTAMDNYDKLTEVFDNILPIAVALNNTTPYVEKNVTSPTFAEYTSGTTTTSSDSNADAAPASDPESGGESESARSSGANGKTSTASKGAASNSGEGSGQRAQGSSGARTRAVGLGGAGAGVALLLGGLVAGGMRVLFGV